MAGSAQVRSSARWVVAEALATIADCYPDTHPVSELAVRSLAGRDARLALAIYRTALQRWITLEYLLNLSLNKPVSDLEPRLRGVLVSAAAQIIFLNRLPVYAVVDESVEIARSLVRPRAAALVNAVLRRLSAMAGPTVVDEPWRPASDRLPLDDRSVLLNSRLLPPVTGFVDYMHVATSHPVALIDRWVGLFGQEQTAAICWHNVQTPPTIVALDGQQDNNPFGANGRFVVPHRIPGFVLWRGGHDRLVGLLGRHPAWRVQDPASARPVTATAPLSPRWCVDYCAGRGTKTRQLALLHPQTRIIACDASADRMADLCGVFAGHSSVNVVALDGVAGACPSGGVDLLVLDVPCTNTAVLARRPEARYRFNGDTLGDLVKKQRRIVESAMPLLRSGGHLLYSTCSLEEQENRDQADWIMRRYGAKMVSQGHTLPAGAGAAYHDGSYHALLQVPANRDPIKKPD